MKVGLKSVNVSFASEIKNYSDGIHRSLAPRFFALEALAYLIRLYFLDCAICWLLSLFSANFFYFNYLLSFYYQNDLDFGLFGLLLQLFSIWKWVRKQNYWILRWIIDTNMQIIKRLVYLSTNWGSCKFCIILICPDSIWIPWWKTIWLKNFTSSL